MLIVLPTPKNHTRYVQSFTCGTTSKPTAVHRSNVNASSTRSLSSWLSHIVAWPYKKQLWDLVPVILCPFLPSAKSIPGTHGKKKNLCGKRLKNKTTTVWEESPHQPLATLFLTRCAHSYSLESHTLQSLVLKENPSSTTGLCFLNKLSFRKRRKLRFKIGNVRDNFGLCGQDTNSVTKGFLGQTAALQKELGWWVMLLNKELLNSKNNRLEQGLHTWGGPDDGKGGIWVIKWRREK